jgi:hypothetical protein
LFCATEGTAQAGSHDHVVAVSGNHDELALGEHTKASGDALGEHRHLLDTPGQVAHAEYPRAQLAYPQPGQVGAVRHRGDEAEPALGQPLAQLRCRQRIPAGTPF